MKNTRNFFLFFLLISCVGALLTSCLGRQEPSHFRQLDYSSQSVKLRVPKMIWEKLTKDYRSNFRFNNQKYDFIQPLPTTVILDGSKNVLGESGYHIKMADFGGDVNFSELISGSRKGKFKILFDPAFEKEQKEKLRVFFVPGAKARTVGSEKLGTGCGKALELTGFFKKDGLENGIEVHTGQDRHITALAGRFFFVIPESNRLRIAQITISSPIQTELLCEGKI